MNPNPGFDSQEYSCFSRFVILKKLIFIHFPLHIQHTAQQIFQKYRGKENNRFVRVLQFTKVGNHRVLSAGMATGDIRGDAMDRRDGHDGM